MNEFEFEHEHQHHEHEHEHEHHEHEHHQHHHHSNSEKRNDYAQEFRNKSLESIKRRKFLKKWGFRVLILIAIFMLAAVIAAYTL